MKKLTEPNNDQANIGDWVIQKNNQFIAFNKPAGLPVQADKTEDKSLQDLAQIYTKQKLYLCNRIDRPATGIVIFAKNQKAAAYISQQFSSKSIDKVYLAVVKSPFKHKESKVEHLLEKNEKINKSFVVQKASKFSKPASLGLNLRAESDRYTLLQIQLHTGRHHQIRAQLAYIGYPIKGDVKYGARRSNKDRSIHLHAWKLELTHPISKERIILKAELPQDSLWQFFKESLLG